MINSFEVLLNAEFDKTWKMLDCNTNFSLFYKIETQSYSKIHPIQIGNIVLSFPLIKVR